MVHSVQPIKVSKQQGTSVQRTSALLHQGRLLIIIIAWTKKPLALADRHLPQVVMAFSGPQFTDHTYGHRNEMDCKDIHNKHQYNHY